MQELYLNGAFVASAAATISVLDRGFLFGDGVYEVIPAYRGRPLRLTAHLDRLDASLRGIRLDNPLPRDRWRAIFARLLRAAPDADLALYLQITRGAPPARDHRFPAKVPPTVLVMTKPIASRDPRVASVGVSAILRADTRWQRCDLKVISLVAAVLLRQEAAELDAEETLLERDGLVVEGSTSNVFAVLGGALVTPPKGPALLPGITRDLVVELAREAGLEVHERAIKVAEARAAEELWLTSSTREVVPVTQLDGQAIGSGRPGPLWQLIDERYRRYKETLEPLW